MAIRDVKQYYYSQLMQYSEMKADLDDLEQALKDGLITEDKLSTIKENIAVIESNFNRIQYIMYLAEIPNRKSKKDAWKKANAEILEYLKSIGADNGAVDIENKSSLDIIRAEIKKIKQMKKD